MSVNGTLSIALNASMTAAADLGTPRFDTSLSDVVQFTPGTGANQANIIWSDTRTIAASGTDDLDLAGVLTHHLGGTLTFAAVKAIIVRAAAANTNNVVVGGAPTNGFVGPFGAAAHTIALRPGNEFVLASPVSGWTVTAVTGDILRIANSGAGTPVTYDIIIIGH